MAICVAIWLLYDFRLIRRRSLPHTVERRRFLLFSFPLTQRRNEDRSSSGAPPLVARGSVTLSLLRLVVPFDRVPPPPCIAKRSQIGLIVSKFISKVCKPWETRRWSRNRGMIVRGRRGAPSLLMKCKNEKGGVKRFFTKIKEIAAWALFADGGKILQSEDFNRLTENREALVCLEYNTIWKSSLRTKVS